MKKIIKMISPLLSVIILLSSCSPVYITPEDSSSVNEDDFNSEEFFTQGTVYTQGNSDDYYWNGYWLYFETQTTVAQIGNKEDGTPIYGNSTIERLVKYNPGTGLVSSVCLNPSCNHSYESGCLMIVPQRMSLNDPYVIMRINGICGDWVMLMVSATHDEYGATNELRAYNMKTGEARILTGEELGGEIMVRWTCRATFGNKLYRIKNILDYSKTKYKPGEKNENVLNYTPETTCILYEYDFDTNTDTELFEVPSDYDGICAVSNKRFFFQKTEGEIYSCKRDGSDWKKEYVLDFAPDNFFGSFAFDYIKNGALTVYDLETNRKNNITPDFEVHSVPMLMNKGIVFSCCPSYKEANTDIHLRIEQLEKDNPTLSYSEIMELWSKMYQDILFNGSSQIWKCDFNGENMALVCEIEKAVVDPIFAIDQYLLAKVIYWDEVSDKGIGGNFGNRCVINLETGEFSELPLFDVIVPNEYVN